MADTAPHPPAVAQSPSPQRSGSQARAPGPPPPASPLFSLLSRGARVRGLFNEHVKACERQALAECRGSLGFPRWLVSLVLLVLRRGAVLQPLQPEPQARATLARARLPGLHQDADVLQIDL